MRCQLLLQHSQRNERIPVARIEVYMQMERSCWSCFVTSCKTFSEGGKKNAKPFCTPSTLEKSLTRWTQKKKDQTVESLTRSGGIDVWKKWAKPKLDAKQMRPGSVKSYFTSLAISSQTKWSIRWRDSRPLRKKCSNLLSL